MAAINRLTIMLIDSDRFFSDGVLSFIKNQYPNIIVKSSCKIANRIDVLMTGFDRVSISVARFYAPKLSQNGIVLLMHDADEVKRRDIPEALKQKNVILMRKKQRMDEFAARLASLVGDGGNRTQLTIIDKQSVESSALTPQEKILVGQLRNNGSINHIANEMKLHPKTISCYKRSAMMKLDMPHNLEFYHWLLYS